VHIKNQADADDRIVCPVYLDFVRTKPCCVCPSTEVEAHHLIHRGWRDAKRNDFTAVPLCRDDHDAYHTIGLIAFNGTRHCDLWEIAALLLAEFFLTHDKPEVTVGKRLQNEFPNT
jgi:hypothetical protein